MWLDVFVLLIGRLFILELHFLLPRFCNFPRKVRSRGLAQNLAQCAKNECRLSSEEVRAEDNDTPGIEVGQGQKNLSEVLCEGINDLPAMRTATSLPEA